jgi:hypothetical protein
MRNRRILSSSSNSPDPIYLLLELSDCSIDVLNQLWIQVLCRRHARLVGNGRQLVGVVVTIGGCRHDRATGQVAVTRHTGQAIPVIVSSQMERLTMALFPFFQRPGQYSSAPGQPSNVHECRNFPFAW